MFSGFAAQEVEQAAVARDMISTGWISRKTTRLFMVGVWGIRGAVGEGGTGATEDDRGIAAGGSRIKKTNSTLGV